MSESTESRQDEKVLFAPVPPELHTRARIRALKEGRAVARLVEDAVTRYLDQEGELAGTG